jgi:hypothetical protein
VATFADDELYRRGAQTLVASWAAYAGGGEGAVLLHESGVVICDVHIRDPLSPSEVCDVYTPFGL